MPPVVQSLDHPIYNSEGRESIFNWSLNVFLSFLVLISPSSKLIRSEEVLPMPSHKGMREHWVQLGAHNCLEHIHYTPFSILGFVSHALLVAKTTQRCLVQRTPCGTRFNEISAHPLSVANHLTHVWKHIYAHYLLPSRGWKEVDTSVLTSHADHLSK